MNVTDQQPRRTRISAIVACYRDEQAIPVMYERLLRTFDDAKLDGEFIFVNDGSPDRSGEVLRGLAGKDRRVVVINHSRNFGSQSAFTSGMAIASGDAVVLLDGDLQDPPELIAEFVERWREGYDVVYGARIKRKASASMRVAYKVFYRIFRKLSYVNVPVDAGDFSLLDRRVVDALNRLPEKNRFIRGLRAWVGFRQTGVPYTRPERMFGVTTNSLVKNIGWARKAIVSFSYKPLDFIGVAALVIVAVSFLLIVSQIAMRILWPWIVPSGFTTLIVLILFMGGVQLLCLSIIGSYLAHIYDEVKRRPPFIVESILNEPRKETEPQAGENAD